MKSVQPKNGYAMTVSACIWLGLFPLLQGGTYARITHDKWVIMLILTGVTLLCFLIDIFLRCFLKKNSRELSSPLSTLHSPLFTFRSLLPLIIATALMLWTALSCFVSSFEPSTWWFGEAARNEGLLTQLCYFALFACFFFSRIRLKPVLLSAAIGVAVFFVIVLLQRAGGNPLGLFPGGRSYTQNPEFQGTIGNIDMGTGYLLLLAGLFLYGIISSLSTLHSPPSVLFSVLLFLAFSLTVYLIITMDVQFGIISLAVLFIFTLLRFLPKKWRLPLLVLLIILALVVVWFWPGQGGGIWELHEIIHGRGRLSFGSNRVAVWLYSLRMAEKVPALGGGSGTFRYRFNDYLSENGLSIPKEQDGVALPDYFDTPHNEYIAQLTDHGFPAMLLFLVLLLLAVFRRQEKGFPILSPCSAAVLCYAVQAFFSFSVCLVAPMFWVVLALSFTSDSHS